LVAQKWRTTGVSGPVFEATVVKLEVNGAKSATLFDARTSVETVIRYVVEFLRAADGDSVAVLAAALKVTFALTLGPPLGASVMVDELIVEAFIGPLNNTETVGLVATPVVPSEGVTLRT
jgi:hypothetical protein